MTKTFTVTLMNSSMLIEVEDTIIVRWWTDILSKGRLVVIAVVSTSICQELWQNHGDEHIQKATPTCKNARIWKCQ